MTETTAIRPTVLIVDDSSLHIGQLSNLLKEQYRIKVANNGIRALKLAASQPPDLILLDVMMPVMDGYEVCRQLKSNEATRLVPVIFLTAKSEIEDEALGLSLGAVDFIHKPISPPIVLARIKTHLELKFWNDDLQNQIAKRIEVERELNEMIRQVEKKELAKSRFLASAGHDLRQPLAAANLFVDALKLSEPSAAQIQIIERLEHAIATFNGLLDALLNISKLDAGVIKPEYTAIDVVEIFKSLEQNFAPLAKQKHLRFRMFFPLKERLSVSSDLGLLNSILMNLVSNAINYTFKGSILVAVRKRGEKALFQVWDTGIGISEEQIEHIYDEFYQVDNPQRDRTKGLGLGLAIVKRAAALLGRKISCRSREGKGTVFEFSLPLFNVPADFGMIVAPNQAAPRANLETQLRGKRFVILENDALVAEAMIATLTLAGAEVNLFQRTGAALEFEDINIADYFIVDYMLDGTLNGIQFLNLLQEKLGHAMNALLLTGDTSSAFVQEAVDCAWPVLHKPVNMSKLLAALTENDEILNQQGNG